MVKWTLSSAPTSRVAAFTVLLGLIPVIINLTSFYIYSSYDYLNYTFIYLVAITMGPLWGTIIGLIIAAGILLPTLGWLTPTPELFLWYTILWAAPGILVGFMVQKIRPVYAMDISDAIAFTLTLAIYIPMFGMPLNVLFPSIILSHYTIQIISFLATWVLVSYPPIYRHFPGYTKQEY